MIIKKASIESFAGIKGKIIEFKNGFNLIYGENEKGKSTIENFIRIWLYGFDNSRGKLNDRRRYSPLSGEKMSGELTIEHEEEVYTIRRSFGLTKKEDVCEIVDDITGDKIELFYENEPGKNFLKINSSTFSKTLFINQLGVAVNKDKEEEIMEKITNIYNSGEENISVKKAIEILEKGKKQLITSRKLGELDLLREKRDSLKEELWEGYKLAEENIENEEELLKKIEYKAEIKGQIENLELYRKYIKKIKLQKDYKEIVEYLKKGEELKKREKEISGELRTSDKILTQEFLEEINKDYTRYLSLNDMREEKLQEKYNLENQYEEKKEEYKEFNVFNSIEDDDIKEKVYILKMEKENLEEKINNIKDIKYSIEELQKELNYREREIVNLEWISKNRDNIDDIISSYKEGLKELKYKLEDDTNKLTNVSSKDIKNKLIIIYILSIIGIIAFIFSIIKGIFPLSISLIPIFIVLIKFYLKYSLEIKTKENLKKQRDGIENLKEKVDQDEKKLKNYVQELKCNNFEEFMNKLKQYDSYKIYKENIMLTINTKKETLNSINSNELKEKYNKNNSIIYSLFNVFSCNSLEEIIGKINLYENLKKELLPLEYEISKLKSEILNINIQLKEREEDLRQKTSGMDLEKIEILDFHIKLKDFRDKISKMQEIKNNLNSVNETYKVLLKNRDINEIKEEMKEIINNNIKYSYESEEEIDKELKNKSDELLSLEKDIKDLEHNIEKRYLGKREVSVIEEEISIVEEKISKAEKEASALELASSKLQEAFLEVRKNIAPELNNTVLNKFNYLSSGNYKEVKISEEYKLKVKNDNNLFDIDILSNGAKDQLYLSLRLSFVEMLFKNKDVSLFLDDAFVQYDDERRTKALKLLIAEKFKQILFFTCQSIDKEILDKNKIKYNLIQLS
ncbi:AAA family ATPase [Clostridium weizhouense]|uniref:AAA family ATPase n=1 Tax=Clostridium weizhouense TaxID=2859781 RepID=A0ABS7AJK1_9CLOT|nr:AAA family ATPase [Clostridium weizhouense]MBW6408848.1 AAA family ATPase [Clostridium weizhouense]